MALPSNIPVRISSEAAGSISMTPVLSRNTPVREIVETILATTGKDARRVREILTRGAVVQGASRFRWEPLAATDEDVADVLSGFPDPDPKRPFSIERCTVVRLKAGRQIIEIPREAASERRFMKRRSFWDVLIEIAARNVPVYMDYSYRTRSDEYRSALPTSEVASLRAAADLLRYSGLAAQIRMLGIDCIEYSVRFP